MLRRYLAGSEVCSSKTLESTFQTPRCLILKRLQCADSDCVIEAMPVKYFFYKQVEYLIISCQWSLLACEDENKCMHKNLLHSPCIIIHQNPTKYASHSLCILVSALTYLQHAAAASKPSSGRCVYVCVCVCVCVYIYICVCVCVMYTRRL